MIKINRVHHIAIICSDYQKSKRFYTEILGFKLESEVYREARLSYKADLSLNGHYLVELFSFPNPPQRPTQPESTGLRHLAFEVDDVQHVVHVLGIQNIKAEPVRTDECTGKQFTFIADPDHLPIEFYEK